MDDLSIHELVRSFPIVSRFLDSAEKTFFAGRHIFSKMQQIYQLFWLDFFSPMVGYRVPHSQ